MSKVDPNRLPWWAALSIPPFAALGAAALYLRSHWEEIPARFPVHWGIDGQPNRWVLKTPQNVYGPLLFGGGVMILLLLMGVAMYYGSRPTPLRNAVLKVFVGMTYLMALVFGSVGLMPIVRISPLALLLPAPLVIVAAIWWTMRAAESEPDYPTPDECWHWGAFYYNPADPALMVPKRLGWGYTFNFANRLSWLLLGGFLSGLALLFLLLPR